MTPEQQQATAAIHEYFRRVTARIAHGCLADVKSREDWDVRRPLLRQQLLEMLGLSPLPPKTDLRTTVTGTIEHDGFVVEKLHFQSMPNLYVTANFYRPKNVDKPLPTVLYLCGHGNTKIDNVSYGSKVNYQHHPTWFVRNGYCCLILDTHQLGEIEGIHHGTHRFGMWWWLARGYTAAGVEAWNCVRALDYLETRPEVDMKRIGVTGRSGGGAYTWWLAAIDDRPACLVPVAGITDLENHVVDGCIEGHCDCMFMVNTYQWDFPMVAALAAPRPLLLSNSDKDNIFPLSGVVRTHAKMKKIYDLYGASSKLGLLITEGPHRDTQDLQVPAFRWMNRWLKNSEEQISAITEKPFQPQQLKVFAQLPSDECNTKIQETFTPPAQTPIPPSNKADWERQREEWLAALKEKSFRGWTQQPVPLEPKRVTEKTSRGLTLHVIEYTSDENLRFPIYVVHGSKHSKPSLLVVTVVDNDGWNTWLKTFAPAFGDVLPHGKDVTPDPEAFDANVKMLTREDWAFATVAPRGIGPNQWDPDLRKDTHIQRRFVLLGQTADSGRVWDVRRAIQSLKTYPRFRSSHLWLQGAGASAGIALYAGLFEPDVERFDLHRPTTTHHDGLFFLNVLRILDMPQAAALAFPRKVILYDTQPQAWEWTSAVAKLYDARKPPLELRMVKSATKPGSNPNATAIVDKKPEEKK